MTNVQTTHDATILAKAADDAYKHQLARTRRDHLDNHNGMGRPGSALRMAWVAREIAVAAWRELRLPAVALLFITLCTMCSPSNAAPSSGDQLRSLCERMGTCK